MPFTKRVVANIKNVLALLLITALCTTNVVAATFTYTPSSIVPASGAIPDNACNNNGVTVTFDVTDDFNINDVNMGINITHTWRGDLVAKLSSPLVTNIELVSDIGGDVDNLNVTFDSDSANVLASGVQGTAPDFAFVVQPEIATVLNSFDNTDALGTWTFFVCDNKANDLGTVTAAQLTFDGTSNIINTQINGNVYKELNNDGNKDANEIGVQGVTVTAYDLNGVAAGSTLTDANGDYTIAGLPNAQEYRLEFTSIPFGYQSSIQGASSSTSVVFVTTPANNVNYGVGDSTQYCQINPDLITSLFRPQSQTTNSALISFPLSNTGDVASDEEADYNAVGSTWGLAYQRESDILFASAYLKRHVKFGPGGAGAGDETGSIYRIDNPSDGLNSAVTEFLNLNDLIGSNVTGVNPHATDASLTVDNASFVNASKISFGDMDISDDAMDLWVVNLANRNLYRLPLGSDPRNPVAPTLAQITAIDMLSAANYSSGAPNCAGGNADNFRPFAVKYHKHQVFVGAVCSAETGGAGLDAHVYALDVSTSQFTEVLTFALNYNRGCGLAFNGTCLGGVGVNSANWNPWSSTYTANAPTVNPLGEEFAYPQPILSDIEFTNDEQMIIGFRDRWGDQIGHNQQTPDNSSLIKGEGYGDIVRATVNAGGASWSFNATEATEGTEFYSGDSWTDGSYTHFETGYGGLISMPSTGTVSMTNMDPITPGGQTNDFAGGVRSYLVASGNVDHSYQVYSDASVGSNVGTTFFGKSNGIGDLEALCDTPTQELGSRVWNDINTNGIQDAGESGLAGVVVQMIDTDGVTVLGTVTTDADGQFYFNNAAGVDVLGKDYNVNFLSNVSNYLFRIDTTQAVLAGFNVTGLGGTGASLATNDLHDSDAVVSGNNAEITVASGYSGQSNHSYDFGFRLGNVADLSLVKNVSDSFPIIGTQVTFTLSVANNGPDNATNFTVVDSVPNGFSNITNISGGGVLAGSTITWSGLSLANGATMDLTFDVTVNAFGIYNNLAQITASAESDPDSTPNNGVDTDNDGNTDDDSGDEDDGDGEPVSPVEAGTCVIGNNDIGGIVFRDFNQNGTQDVLEPGFGVAGMIVTAYNSANIAVATTPVNANGLYVFNGLVLTDYRLELSGIPDYLQYGVAGAQMQSGVRFINAASCSADFSVNNPADYCQADPNFIISRFTKDERTGANSGLNTILQYNYLDNGTDAPTNLKTYQDLGSIYGLAHLRKSNRTYASTYFKRHTDIGPNGIGAIYAIDHSAGNTVSVFANLPGTYPAARTGAAYDWNHDTLGYSDVAKTGVGDIDISDDESQFFAVNLSDRRLYVIDINADGTAGVSTDYAIPNPCPTIQDFRPMGLGFNDDLLYVGVTCTAESTVDANNADDSTNGPRKGDKTALSAHVYSFSPATNAFSAAAVVDIDLTYDRGCIYSSNISNQTPATCSYVDQDGLNQPYRANWNPWQMDYDIVFNDKKPGNIGNQNDYLEYMQPLLSDIEFDSDGSMVIQIRDVNGDRGGFQNSSPNPADNTLRNMNGEGDIIRACGNAQTGWTLENNGACGGVTTNGANNNEGIGGGEFYWNDNGPGGTNHSNIGYTGIAGHGDTFMGGLLLIPGKQELITGAMDTQDFVDSGLIWVRNDTGEIAKDGLNEPKRLLVTDDANTSVSYGKANGIGDIEALCDPAPIEIGNRIWNDTDGDGIQDADEPGIDGITVTLTCGVDSATAITANGGQYYFTNGAPVNAGTTQALFMDSGENCQLSVNNNQPGLASFALTTQNADADVSNDSTTDVRDSDASISGIDSVIAVTIEASGHNNHSYDFGFEPQVVLIDYGDAPDTAVGTGSGNYQTTNADNGPSHIISNGLYMGGGVPDSEADGQPNALASGDDVVGSSDEDGPQNILNFLSGDTPSIDIKVTNQTGSSAVVSGWIDYNSDGVFDNSEAAFVVVPTGTMSSLVTLTFPVVPAGVANDTIMRIRFGTSIDLVSQNPVGAAGIGEIEDHRVTFNQDLSGNSQLCYVAADGGDRLVTTNPLNGSMDDTAAGLGNIPYTSIETMAWDLGNPLISGDEVLYGADVNDLVQLLPTPRSVIGTFNNGVVDSDGFAIDWQSIPPVYYASGSTGGGHIKIFNFNPANANVLNISDNIALPLANTQIDDIAWDPINRRLLGVTNNGTTLSHIVQFDLTNLSTTGVVDAFDCGAIMFNGSILQDTEGLTFSHPGELFISTGELGPADTNGGLYRVSVNGLASDCSAIVGAAPDILTLRVGPVNTLNAVAGTDHESIDCSLTFTESRASIGNRVWLDEDSDGEQDAGEDGIGDVNVYLCRDNGQTCNAANAIQVSTTDANGGYLFRNLPILDYVVAVETNTVPANLVTNPTYDEDSGTITPNHQTFVSLSQINQEYLTADFGYNWNNSPETGTPVAGAVGSIGDRVWNDANADGVQNANEAGMNSVTVNLYTDPDGDSIYNTLVATTTTDENGNYIFDGLASGAYVVEVNPLTLPAGVVWTQTGDPDEYSQVATAVDHRTTSPVILAPGDVFVNADFGYQGDVAHTHSIGDTIYLDSNANGVINVGEKGIANITIALIDANGNTLAQTATDTNGNYIFSGLPDAVYSIVVTDTNNVLAGLVQSADPDATLDNKSVVTLSGADNFAQDFGYKPLRHTAGTGLIGDTLFLDIDGNGIQSASETGIEGVTVELIDTTVGSPTEGYPIARTVTDENGNYYFGNLPDGNFSVVVDTTTLPNSGIGLSNTADPDGGTANQSENISIAGGNTNLNQDFGYQVNTPNQIGGNIWNDNNADGNQDNTETTDFAGVTISLLDLQGNVVGTTVTDINGNYQFTGLPDGTYTIVVTDDNNVLAGHWLTDGINDGSDNNSQVVGYTVTVTGGQNNQTGDFGYYVNLASIGNIVYRDDNNDGVRNPATEPGIPLVPVTLTITYPNNDTVTLTTLTDGAGFYSFENLLADDSYQKAGVPGNGLEPSYSISVGAVATGFTSTYDGVPDAAGFNNGTNNNSDNTNGEIAYPVKGAAELTNDFGFVPGATIGNRVWLDLDGDGIQDANEDGIANRIVQLTPPAGVDVGAGVGNPITTVTDTNGNYIFTELPLVNGYTLTVTNPPAGLTETFDEDGAATPHTSQVDLTVANEEHLTADFGYITPDGTIGDYIWADANGDGQQDPFEVGLANIDVYLCDTSANPCDSTTPAINVIAMTTTDAAGHYSFTGVSLTAVHNIGVDTTTLPAGYVQTGDPDGVGAPDSQTTVLALNSTNNINLDADFGYQPPVANHSDIGDIIYQDLDGNGMQSAGESGIPGITVQLFVDSTADGIPDTPIASEVTDTNGNYLFPSLPNSVAYSVVVTDTNNILNNFNQTADPDGVLDNQSIIPILIADKLDQDFGYRPIRKGNGIIGDRIFHDVNSNGVQDAGDQGLEGVIVRVFDSNGNLVDSVVTDENGQYLFTGLDPSGTYTVVVETSSLPNNGVGWNTNIDPDGIMDAQTVVNLALVPSGIVLDQDFGFVGTQSNTIQGTVWSDNDGNGLLTDGTGADPDETQNGLENVTVELKDVDGNIVATTTTDANGDYSFTGLPDGTYSVSVTDKHNELANLSHTDGPNAGDNTVDNNSQDDTGYNVSVAGGNTNSTADFGYQPVVTTPITLASFSAKYNQNTGETTITWSTETETGNIGFDVYLKIDGIWKQANKNMIASKAMYSTELKKYQFVYNAEYSTEWALVDIDIKGKRQSHGTFKLDKSYGQERSSESVSKTKWQQFNQLHNEKNSQRDAVKSNAINDYIKAKIENEAQSTGEGS